MEQSSKDIWCCIPVHNNRDTVKGIAIECLNYVPNVIVVDDGSTDTDVEALFEDTNITVLKHEKNLGKGRALSTALNYINQMHGKFMITIDADGQHYPKDIDKMIPLLKDDTIVIGCRNFDGENIPSKSKHGRAIANFWLRIEAGIYINDCQSGFRAYPVGYLTQMKLAGNHYDFETEVLARGVWAGLELKPVDIDVLYPKPEARVSSFRPILDNIRISLMHTRLVGRRLLPIPNKRLVPKEEVQIDLNILKHPVKLIKMLLHENTSPMGLAAAAGVGIFLAVLPLLSVHTLVIIYVTSRLHLNKVMACAIQNICIPPFVPVLCIEIGHYMLHKKWLTEVSPQVIFGQIKDRIFEWFLGSLIVAPLLAIIVGVVIFFAALKMQHKKVSDEIV